jgi:hypothetical protein
MIACIPCVSVRQVRHAPNPLLVMPPGWAGLSYQGMFARLLFAQISSSAPKVDKIAAAGFNSARMNSK